MHKMPNIHMYEVVLEKLLDCTCSTMHCECSEWTYSPMDYGPTSGNCSQAYSVSVLSFVIFHAHVQSTENIL